MGDLFFGGLAPWFSVPAFAGSFFFMGRMALALIGGNGHDSAFDVDAGGGDVGHDHSSGAFKFLSIQAISAFAMGFGWGGLAAYRGTGIPAVLSAGVGVAFGVGMMWMLAKMLAWITRMQTSGTLDIRAALFEEGVVYATIPGNRSGRGTVRVVVSEHLRYYTATTEGDALPTSTPVKVVGINDDNTITVEPLTRELPPAEA